ncbi:MAG: TadE/TadG family type IV pilus assembly protein [Terriglobales bacterium]
MNMQRHRSILTGAGPRARKAPLAPSPARDPLDARPGCGPGAPARSGPRLIARWGRAALRSYAAISHRFRPQRARRAPRVRLGQARGRRCRGQALTELAIILPLCVLLLLGVEELGRLAYTAIVVDHAAHAGALYGAQNPTTAVNNPGMIQAALADGGELTSLTASATHVCSCSSGGAAADCSLSDCLLSRLQVYAQVNTSATFTPICNFFGWPAPLTLHSQATIEAKP